MRASDDVPFGSSLFLIYNLITLNPATGWSNVPTSYSPAQETVMVVTSFRNPNYDHHVYIYDSTDDGTVNYDRALLVLDIYGKDGSMAAGDLAEGDWVNEKLEVTGSFTGWTGGMWIKLEELNDDVNGDGTKDGRVEIREGYIHSAYQEADETLALIRSLMPSNSMVGCLFRSWLCPVVASR